MQTVSKIGSLPRQQTRFQRFERRPFTSIYANSRRRAFAQNVEILFIAQVVSRSFNTFAVHEYIPPAIEPAFIYTSSNRGPQPPFQTWTGFCSSETRVIYHTAVFLLSFICPNNIRSFPTFGKSLGIEITYLNYIPFYSSYIRAAVVRSKYHSNKKSSNKLLSHDKEKWPLHWRCKY